jgi:tetratricopeptide (TPR) repeat protein
LLHLANNLGLRGDFIGSNRLIRQALRLEPDNVLAQLGLGANLLVQWEWKEGSRVLLKVSETVPPWYPAEIKLVSGSAGHWAAGRYTRAAALARQLLEKTEEDVVRLGAGFLLMLCGETESGEAAIRQVQQRQPAGTSDGTVELMLCFALGFQGKPAEAEKMAREAIRLMPESGEVAQLTLALPLFQQARFAEVRDALRKAKGSSLVSIVSTLLGPALWLLERAQKQLDAVEASDLKQPYSLMHAEVARMEGRYYLAHRINAKLLKGWLGRRNGSNDSMCGLFGFMPISQRVSAASAAVQAAAGQGKGKLAPENERAAIRQQGLAWLREEFQNQVGRAGKETNHVQVKRWLSFCRCCPGFACVREPAALARLPQADRKQWQALWAEMAALLKKLQ